MTNQRETAQAGPALVTVSDYEAAAKLKLSPAAWAYFSGGSGDEITLRRNCEALDAIQLKPHILVDVSHIDTSCTLLGHRMEHPILLAPTSSHLLAHPEGELATVRGADAAGAILVASTHSNHPIEQISAIATGPLWFQIYIDDNRDEVRALIRRAEAAGAKVLCVTVDNPMPNARNREERVRSQAPVLPFPNVGIELGPGARGRTRRSFTWKDLEWLRQFVKIPIVLKGFMNPEDAHRAVDYGTDAIVVSNHGARVLDTEPATIEVLPAVVDRVAGRVPVIFDGGIRRGTHILKALAYGACAVMIGRPYLYGLSVCGADGVRNVVRILRAELEAAMALTGCTRLSEIDRSVFWKSRDYSC